ncbi:hypothetical protein VIN7_1257 [Saccharomyces cerevisiae x Saccharomyces kudriavzevii VIN7]|uniref:Uncharacterized protein n=1 Tax=Saccharomyces cerevisiae x Saccharomyces kudriavzevii (strain VIN7) TaxID=1095631 RepID=H0GFD6_SACCK|nr:hypothetical protein VIN7_1257 [Saccharomyces cerevisiae x Saccharomyces kudriavzevii VIN7]
MWETEFSMSYGNLAEWLRRKIRNLLGFARAGSSPAVVVIFLFFSISLVRQIEAVEETITFPKWVKARVLGKKEKFGQNSKDRFLIFFQVEKAYALFLEAFSSYCSY